MSSEPTVTEVFEEIEPDPDAILGAFDADSPDTVLEGAGDHDPVPDDVTAAEVFADLKAVSLEVAEAETTDEPTASAVHRDSGSGTSADASADWEWVGPDPTETRIDNDTFGGVGLEPNGDATGEFAWFEA